jgi:hypothetical protein
MPPYIAETLSFARDGRVLLYAATGPTFPKVIWAYDLASRSTTRILAPDFHGIPAGSLVEPRIVHVRSFDGRQVPAWYFQPKSHAGKLTVLLDVHGGPELQDRAWFYPFAQYLVSQGYALLDPNIRGSTGYGRTYLHLADGHRREGAVKDVAALAHPTRNHGASGGLGDRRDLRTICSFPRLPGGHRLLLGHPISARRDRLHGRRVSRRCDRSCHLSVACGACALAAALRCAARVAGRSRHSRKDFVLG